MNYYKENKSIQKCVRMTQITFDFVDKETGNGFNEKFSNLVKRYETEEEQLERTIARLRVQIEEHTKYLNCMNKLRHNVNRITEYLDYVDTVISDDIPELF